jgi:hypothetical protein
MALVLDGNGTMTVGNGDITGITNGALPSTFIGTGAVLQVVQTAYTGTDTTTSVIPTMASTGCTASITPSSSSNRILAILSMATYHQGNAQQMAGRIMRGSSAAFSGISGDFYHPSGGGVNGNINIQWLDSPATTSGVTYTAQFAVSTSTGQLNRDFFGNSNGVTYLTLMEIAG